MVELLIAESTEPLALRLKVVPPALSKVIPMSVSQSYSSPLLDPHCGSGHFFLYNQVPFVHFQAWERTCQSGFIFPSDDGRTTLRMRPATGRRVCAAFYTTAIARPALARLDTARLATVRSVVVVGVLDGTSSI